jgi:hypothetical protein
VEGFEKIRTRKGYNTNNERVYIKNGYVNLEII